MIIPHGGVKTLEFYDALGRLRYACHVTGRPGEEVDIILAAELKGIFILKATGTGASYHTRLVIE